MRSLLFRLLAATFMCLMVPASAHAVSTGVNMNVSEGSNENMVRLQNQGVSWIRFFHRWDEIEKYKKGELNIPLLAEFKAAGDRAHAHGIKINFVVLGTPDWANGNQGHEHPPTNPADYGDYIRELVTYMGPSLDAIEIWNEADGGEFWKQEGDPAPAYTALLKGSYSKAKAANPNLKVILGGIVGSNYPWLEKLYQLGAQGSFDAVSTHPDTACLVNGPYEYYRDNDTRRISKFVFLGYRAVHDVMVENGDGDKKIIMTEIGWSSAKGKCERGAGAGKKDRGVTEANQALFLKQAWHCLSETPYVESAWWFNYRDLGPASDQGELLHYGLLRHDFTEKPSWLALKQVATGNHGQKGPCGDFVAPDLKVEGLADGLQFADSLPIAVSAADPSGMAKISLSYDGEQKIRSFTPPDIANYPKTIGGEIDWQKARHLPVGPHTVTVRAYDGRGNETARTFNVVKVAAKDLKPVRTVMSLKTKRLGGLKLQAKAQVFAKGTIGRMVGKVKITYEKYDPKKKSWKAVHKIEKPAKLGLITINQKVFSAGTWRVKAQYVPIAPLLASSKKSGNFKLN